MSDPHELIDAAEEELLSDVGGTAPISLAEALRAVLDLHKPMHDVLPECSHCYECGEVVNASWPCPTVQAITNALEGK